MKTRFEKFRDDDARRWTQYSIAGDAWLLAYECLTDRADAAWDIFYVQPFMVAFALELFVKALVSHEDSKCDPKKFSHGTAQLVSEYRHLDPFKMIAADDSLMELIREYEKAKDFKYGEMGMHIDRAELAQLLGVVYSLREKLDAKRRN